MRLPFTRRPLPPAPPETSTGHVTDVQAAEIAVGSLTGIAPSRILRHIVIVVDQDQDLSMVTSCCKHELAQFIGQAHLSAVVRAVAPGPCYHEGGES